MHPILLQFTPFQLRNHLFWILPLMGALVLAGRALMKEGASPSRKKWGLRLHNTGTFFGPVGVVAFVLLWIGTLADKMGWISPELMAYDLKIHTYGLMMATGFIVAISWSAREARRVGLDPNTVVDSTMWLAVSGLIGSKILYVITRWSDYMEKPRALLNVFQAGFVWYGGLIAAFLVGLWVFKRKRLPVWMTADVIAPSVILGLGIGRIGCFSAGCCHGGVCPTGDHWYTVTYPHSLEAVGTSVPDKLLGLPLYPTQLAEVFASFGIFAFLLWFRHRKSFHGQLAFLMTGLYSIWRPINEAMRGDDIRGFLIPGVLTTSQFISALMLAASIAMYFYLAPRTRVDTYKMPEPLPAAKPGASGKKRARA